MPQDFNRCALCQREFDSSNLEAAHVIPKSRGGCDCLFNLVDACKDCNAGEGGQWTLTPLEWWGKQEWDKDESKENGVSGFDYGGWTLEEKNRFLVQAAYWEARALWHMRAIHNKVADYK